MILKIWIHRFCIRNRWNYEYESYITPEDMLEEGQLILLDPDSLPSSSSSRSVSFASTATPHYHCSGCTIRTQLYLPNTQSPRAAGATSCWPPKPCTCATPKAPFPSCTSASSASRCRTARAKPCRRRRHTEDWSSTQKSRVAACPDSAHHTQCSSCRFCFRGQSGAGPKWCRSSTSWWCRLGWSSRRRWTGRPSLFRPFPTPRATWSSAGWRVSRF